MSKSYSFDVITKTGDSVPIGEGSTDSLGKLGKSPSINDYGSIAFVGKFGTEFSAPTDLLVSNSLGDIINLSDSDTWKFSDQVQINNNNQVVARDTASSLQAIRVWDSNAILAENAYSVEAIGGIPSGGKDFEWLYLFQRINNDDQVVFVADPKDGGTYNHVLNGTDLS